MASLIQTYSIPFAPNRKLTNIKANIVNNFMHTNRNLTNLVCIDNHKGLNYWKKMSKNDNNCIREYYESTFQDEENLRTAYANNVYKNANKTYKDTIKGFFSDYGKKQRAKRGSTKRFPKKPFFEEPVRFQLDYRMYSRNTIKKDDKGVFWFCLSNPFNEDYFINNKHITTELDSKTGELLIANIKSGKQKSGKTQQKDLKEYRNQINIPLHGYERVSKMLNQITKGTFNGKVSFALGEDLNSIIINTEIIKQDISTEYLTKDLDKLTKQVSSAEEQLSKKTLGIDFGKYPIISDGTQFNLKKFYHKVDKLRKSISILDKNIQAKKNLSIYDDEYKALKIERQEIFRKIKEVRKVTYNHTINKILKKCCAEKVDFIALEDLSLLNKATKILDPKGGTTRRTNSKTGVTTTKPNMIKNPSYKGRKFNKMLTIMGAGVWTQKLVYKLLVFGKHGLWIEPAYTSQKCSDCGHIHKLNRMGRCFKCLSCGKTYDADYNASKNIRAGGLKNLMTMYKKSLRNNEISCIEIESNLESAMVLA